VQCGVAHSSEHEHNGEPGHRVTIELSMTDPCILRGGPNHCIEVLLGVSGDTPACWIVSGDKCAQLGADYILVQPSVVEKDPTRGWLPLGGKHPTDIYIGQTESPELDLGPSVEGEHLLISYFDSTICLFRIGNRSPVVVRAKADTVIDDGSR
jgi:hypothetical protein